ncbi:MAG: class I SAM-dependent methyltransferase [Deltaproteobacteria bacterium]|nr:class I SAM-dependent methyltransferase [Deltaproteobacteria bacterium]
MWQYFDHEFEYEDAYRDFYSPWAGHKYFSYDLVRNIRPKIIVELGTYRGTSFFSFCQAVKDACHDANLYAVDTWQGDEHGGFYDEDVYTDVIKIKEKYYADLKINLLRKRFDEAVDEFDNHSIDLLHIDGLHTYEAVKHDFEKWLPKVKPDGIILLHDIYINKEDFGVHQFWEELKGQYKTVEFHHSYGLGVLFKDGTHYQSFIDSQKEWQIRYSYIAEDKKNEKIHKSLTSSERLLTKHERQISGLRQIISEQDDKLAVRDGNIARLNDVLSERDGQIATLNGAVSACDRHIAVLNEGLSERDGNIARLNDVLSERDGEVAALNRTVSVCDEQIAVLNEALSGRIADLNRAATERDGALALIDLMKGSTSWRLTRPMRFLARLVRYGLIDDDRRNLSHRFHYRYHQLPLPVSVKNFIGIFRQKKMAVQMEKAGAFAIHARNALRYVGRRDFDGLKKRIHFYQADQFIQKLAVLGPPKRWGVIATPHTLFVAHLVASRLRAHNFEVDIMTNPPAGFPHDMYVVICAQMLDVLPPGEKRIVYQMEQSVSSRWFTDAYIKILECSLAVLEYSLVNVAFMAGKGVMYPHVHYLPVGAGTGYMDHLPPVEKTCDVLFYGDANSSPRRREMLNVLRRHFNVRMCSEIFDMDMVNEIRRARTVINLHYYKNALLEMPRIQECLSLGVPVITETAQDQADYPDLTGAVIFFEEGNEQAMIEAVRRALHHPVEPETIRQAVAAGAGRFAFMFDRFLVAMGFLPASKLADDVLPLPQGASHIVLSMPETIARRRLFEANCPQCFAVFDGIRLRPGWVGCGLSYAKLAGYALSQGMHRLTILEDDALLPEDFEGKMRIIHAYLDAKEGQWDVFAGLITTLHSEVKVLGAEMFQGMLFVTIDKMTGMVCNVYSEKVLRILASWDPDHRDDQTNTIDKYLERQTDLRIVVTLPFLAGHREEVHSTLWGFQNTQYRELIAESERTLQESAGAFL